MLKTFLVLYLKKTRKGFTLFLITISLTLLIGFVMEQWGIILAIVFTFILFYYLYLELKQTKVCIILDTNNLQKLFIDDNKMPATRGKKFTTCYKKWLIQYAIENNLEITYSFFLYNQINLFCCYFFLNVIPMLIVLTLATIYLPYFHAWIVALIFLGTSLTLFLFSEIRLNKKKFKLLDSEIKRILFEEETGYSPVYKKKFTFKYRVWLIIYERNQTKSIFVNNI